MASACQKGRGTRPWKLYRAAAAAGFTTALANLGLQYRKGEGVPQDYAESHAMVPKRRRSKQPFGVLGIAIMVHGNGFGVENKSRGSRAAGIRKAADEKIQMASITWA